MTDEPLRIKYKLGEWFDPQDHKELRDLNPGETKEVILDVGAEQLAGVVEIDGAHPVVTLVTPITTAVKPQED